MKRLYVYILKQFFGVFLLTLVICVFILLMQFVWSHVNDLVGKGVGITVLAEFAVYAAASVIPLAMPLAILLGALMTFGNLGERVELTAMKAAGISLIRVMKPLIVAISFVSVGAFAFSNYVLPKSQVKLWTLIFSLRQKSPEFDIPVGEFYSGIEGYQVYVRDKDPKTGLLKNLMIYDFSEGFEDATVMVADSGRVYFSTDNKYLRLTLYSGESFENLKGQRISNNPNKIPYRREIFSEKNLLIDFDSEFSRFDESILHDQYVAKNAAQLSHSADSVTVIADSIAVQQSADIVGNHYFNREYSSAQEVASPSARQVRHSDINDVYAILQPQQRYMAACYAADNAHKMSDQVTYNRIVLHDPQQYVRRHKIEWHRKFSLALACLIFFFIGAPLGAIIGKGGLGVPTVVSVAMFIFYYIIDNSGYKMARDALWQPWQGMWISTAVLLPIGIFLTYKAAHDSALFNTDAWLKMWGIAKNKALALVGKLKIRKS
ncbi:MAG: LptF/LptG family permease [Paludibacteraceae bacterium]|nr:LptF/LptG family permease [Paludibacteraceae bacterium]